MHSNKLDSDAIKDQLGKKAAQFVEDGMLIGLGTGSTASCFILHLAKRCREEKLKVAAVASSQESYFLARQLGIPLMELDAFTRLNLTVDGADEIDPQGQMIKGGGGALLREKILAKSSDRLIIIVEEKKQVESLGFFPLALEVLRFGWRATQKQLESLGYEVHRRKSKQHPFITDSGNYILDLKLHFPVKTPEQEHQTLISIPGIIETGLFCNLANQALIGHRDASISQIHYSLKT